MNQTQNLKLRNKRKNGKPFNLKTHNTQDVIFVTLFLARRKSTDLTFPNAKILKTAVMQFLCGILKLPTPTLGSEEPL